MPTLRACSPSSVVRIELECGDFVLGLEEFAKCVEPGPELARPATRLVAGRSFG